MPLRLVQVNIKAHNDYLVGRFWADALGWSVFSEGPGVTNVEPSEFALPDARAVGIDVVAVPDAETVEYRVHLELATDSPEHHVELVARLVHFGARVVDDSADVPWTSLTDPEGNLFHVLEPRAIYEDTGRIAAVVVESADPRALAEFWHSASDWTMHEVSDDHARLRSSAGVGPYLEFVPLAAERAQSRMHIDLRPYPGDDLPAEVARLKGLGASDADIGQGDVAWKVLRDPEGNDFCVLTPG